MLAYGVYDKFISLVTREPRDHATLYKNSSDNNNNDIKKTSSQHFPLLSVSQDFNHLQLKACEVTFKNH